MENNIKLSYEGPASGLRRAVLGEEPRVEEERGGGRGGVGRRGGGGKRGSGGRGGGRGGLGPKSKFFFINELLFCLRSL